MLFNPIFVFILKRKKKNLKPPYESPSFSNSLTNFYLLLYFDDFLPQEDFEEHAEKAKTLPENTTNENKLILYGLYKQATVGPVNTSMFGFLWSNLRINIYIKMFLVIYNAHALNSLWLE